MATNEVDYDIAELIGNVSVPRLTLPTIRSKTRRSDADGISTVPYYPGINAKKLDIEYTDSSLVTQTVSLTIAGTGYQDLIDDIKALDSTNLEAIDMGGFLGIRNINGGSTHYIKILPQGTPADEAADLLGLAVDPFPGSLSYAGELASSPGHRTQGNPQGTALLSKGDDLQSEAFNRAFVSVLRSVERLRCDLEKDSIQHIELAVVVQNHEVTALAQGFYLNDENIRLPLINPGANGTGFLDGYLTLLDTATRREVYSTVTKEKIQILRIHHADSLSALQNASSFATWTAPDGGCINLGDVPGREKHAAITIASISGNVVHCPGASFDQYYVQKNDPVRITGATNTTPFEHNGLFAVQEVLDNEHLKLRPMAADEDIVLGYARPFALNSSGSGFGDLTVYFGNFIPAVDMFVRLYTGVSGGGLPNGAYIARIATGRPVREGLALDKSPFSHGDPSKLGIYLQDHIDDTSAAHAASSIGGFTSATTWYDGSTITGADLKATIEDILTDLSSTTGVSGGGRVGTLGMSATGFTVPFTTANGNLNYQHQQILNLIQGHEVKDEFHPNTGWVSGFTLGTYVWPNQPIVTGTVVVDYLGEVRTFTPSSGQTFNLGAGTWYIYLDLADNTIKSTGTVGTAFSSSTFPLYWIFNQGFGTTWVHDFRIPISTSASRNRGMVTVGPTGTGSDFPNLESAFAWISLVRQGTVAMADKAWEVVVQGTVTMINSIYVTFPVTVRGVAKDASGLPLCKVITPLGQFSGQTVAFQPSMEFTTPPGAYTYTSGVVFKDLHFEVPSSPAVFNSRVIGANAFGHEYGDDWLIDNCVFSGGTNAPYIDIDPHSVIPKNWTFRNCWFKTATRTSTIGHVKLKRASGFTFDNCKFDGQTADAFNMGIDMYQGLVSDINILNCSFDMGGRHIYIVPGTIDNIKIKNCYFKNSRGTTIYHGTGELVIEDCYFNNCLTNASAGDAVILSDGHSGRLIVSNSRFKYWGSEYAIRGITNTSVNSRFVNNIFLSTNTTSDRAVNGFNGALFMGNDFDMYVGASSGNGKNITTVLTTLDNCRVIGNYFRNCGSNASSAGDITLATGASCIATNNHFQNCRGTLISVGGINNVISGNVTNDVGTAATDIGVSVGYAGCVINGNVVTHTTSGKHFSISGDVKAHVHSNALATATNILTGGLAGNAVLKNKAASLGSVGPVSAGATIVVATIGSPTDTFGIHIPLLIGFQASAANLQPGIRTTYADGTYEEAFCNSGAGTTIRYPTDPVSLPAGLSNNLPALNTYDNVVIVKVEIVVRNTDGGAPHTEALGQWRYYGWYIG